MTDLTETIRQHINTTHAAGGKLFLTDIADRYGIQEDQVREILSEIQPPVRRMETSFGYSK